MCNEHAPLFEALLKHISKNPFSFHVPGHGRGKRLPEELISPGGRSLFSLDLTELPGTDDLHNPNGPIARAQELAACVYGAGKSFFLINGSTVGIQALIAAVVGPKKVIVPRNAHRSVLGGLIVSGADPVYVETETIPVFGVDCGVSALTVQRALEGHPQVAAVLTVRPGYYGVARDLEGLVAVVHERDKPLLVDEAHGAHLRFHHGLPKDAMAAGADASVQSTHKLGGALGQCSMMHLQERFIDGDRVKAALGLLQTTSPSYILMTSLDLARRQMALEGEALLERALQLARQARRRLSCVKGIRVLTEDCLTGNIWLDKTKLVISVQGLGITGYQAGSLLAERYNVFVEMADVNNIVAFVTIGATGRDCDALVSAMEDIAVRERLPVKVKLPGAPPGWNKRMKPRDAWFSPSQRVPLTEAKGRICAEPVAVYPPGIPAVNPGEEITSEVQEYLVSIGDMGLPCHGPSDLTLKTIKVVVE